MNVDKVRRFELGILCGIILIDLLFASVAIIFLVNSHAHYKESLDMTGHNLVRLLEQNIADRARFIDDAVVRVERELERQIAAGGIDATRLGQLLDSEGEQLPEVDAIRVTDAAGDVRWGKGIVPGSAVSYADREFFKAHQERATGTLIITEPIKGKVSGTWVIAFTRCYRTADSKFAGVVSAAVPVDSFSKLLTSLNLPRTSTVVLRYADMGLIARIPPLDGAAGQPGNKTVSDEFVKLIESGSPVASFHAVRTPDHVERTYAFRRVSGWPFTIAVGLVDDEYLAPWRTEAIWVTTMLVVFFLVTFIFYRMVVRHLHKCAAMEETRLEDLTRRRILIDQSSDGIVVLDDRGKVWEANLKFAEMLGYTPEEVQQLFVWDWDARWSREELMDQLSRVDTRGYHFETRHRRRDGTVFDVEVSSNLAVSAGSKQVFCVCRDITERKESEVALRKSEQKYRELVEHANSIIVHWDRDGRITFLNEFGQRFFGYSESEILGRHVVGTIVPEIESTRRDLGLLMDRIRSNPRAFEYNVNENMCSNGERVWVAWTNKVRLDDQGRVVGILGIGMNITERKRAEEALSLRESYLTAIIENQPGLVWLKDKEGRFLAVNHAFARSCGLDMPEEVLGKTDLDIWPPDLAQKYRTDDATVLTTGAPVALEEPINDGGEIKWFETFKTPVLDKDGQVLGTSGYARDITERKQAERALEESEAQKRGIMENIGIGVSLISPEMEILELNRRMREWFPTVDPGQHPICYRAFNHPPRENICDYCPTCKTLKDGLVHESTTQTPQGDTVRNYRVISSPVFNSAGEVTAAIEMVDDITDKLSLESQLRQAQKMESVGRLAGGVAHDFNNMLGIILGYTDLAQDRVDPDQPLFADLQEIRKAAERSADLTRQLLAFARKQTVTPRVLDLNETVEGMLKMLRRLIGEDIHLAWLPERDPWPVKVDPSQIDQLLANLCVNARDAIHGVGKLTIETGNVTIDAAYCVEHAWSVAGDYVLLAVSDDGRGMDRETLDKVFEPFFTTKGIGKGTGLGLATVYGIVKQNNGFINVYSEPGHGTCFKIYLPRHKGKTEQMAKGGPLEAVGQGHETILLVEDEPAILKMTTTMLEYQGYTVLAASTPGAAIRLAEAYPGEIHLLMTDVVMPEMNGRDLARNLLELYPNLRRLFMSGYTANVIAHHGVLDSGVNFIQKPFSMRDLAVKLREVLRGTDE